MRGVPEYDKYGKAESLCSNASKTVLEGEKTTFRERALYNLTGTLSANLNNKTPVVIAPVGQNSKRVGLIGSRALLLYVVDESGLISPLDPTDRYRLCIDNRLAGRTTRRCLERAVVGSLRARRIVDPYA